MRSLVALAVLLVSSLAVADDDVGSPPSPPPPPPQNIPPNALEGHRIRGDKHIVPNDVTKVEIQRSGKTRVVGVWKFCIDTAGAITSVNQLKSTGFTAYDQKIQAAIRTWVYRPYKVNGKDVPVCSAVTFVYTQTDVEPSLKIPPVTLEKLRTAGATPAPDAPTLEEMTKRKLAKLVGILHVCIDTSGAVSHVRFLSSTGFKSYDDTLLADVANWQFKPYLANGVAVGACSALTISYKK
jgi:TonB family protein